MDRNQEHMTPDKTEDVISLVDVYKGLWKCRDFEISHLWQRSIFLGTFFLLVFTGYGKLLELYLSSSGGQHASSALGAFQFHGIAAGIACVGLVVSTLWICMAKGSKFWYERYEQAIMDFVERFGKNGNIIEPNASRYAGFEYGKLASDKSRCQRKRELERNRCLWRTGGAKYSPSRINVMIGVLALVLWTLLGAMHVVMLLRTCPASSSSRRLACVGILAAFFLTITVCQFLALNERHSPIASNAE